MKGTVATRALYYGNIASPLMGKKGSDSDHTHKWTILVRGVNNEDISFWIKKVTFRLHETYPNPQRSKYKRECIPWQLVGTRLLMIPTFSGRATAVRSKRDGMGRIRNSDQNILSRSIGGKTRDTIPSFTTTSIWRWRYWPALAKGETCH